MTPSNLTFEVPGPPIPWKRAVSGKNGKRYTPQVQRDYQAHVKACAWSELARLGLLSTWPTEGRYGICVEVRVADYHVSDCDNFSKQVGDATQGLLWRNDTRIDDQRSYRVIAPDRLGLTVQVEVFVAHWSSRIAGRR